MVEIQVFDHVNVMRRERDEAITRAKRIDAEVEELSAERFRLQCENTRLAAQLLQDAPIAAAARAWAATRWISSDGPRMIKEDGILFEVELYEAARAR